jgi:hypothetical protein
MRMITQAVAKDIERRIVELAGPAILKEYGMEIRPDGGTLGSTSFNPKFAITPPLTTPKAPVALDDVRMGLARPGTPIEYGGRKYVVLKRRQVKYLVERIPDKAQYCIRFAACSPTTL